MALEKKLRDFADALKRLRESLKRTDDNKGREEYSFFRDSTIQRFEFTLEIAWKSTKQFLLDQDGVECRSPKACIREFFATGYLDASQAALLLQMIDDRNLATHTYHESLAEEIFSHMALYLEMLEKMYRLMDR